MLRARHEAYLGLEDSDIIVVEGRRYALTLSAFAAALGRSISAVHGYTHRFGWRPKQTEYGLDLDEAIEWCRANVQGYDRAPIDGMRAVRDGAPAGGNGDASDASPDDDESYGRHGTSESRRALLDQLTKMQIRERSATASLKETQLKIDRGQLIPKEAVEKDEAAKIAVVRRALLSLGKTVAPLVVGLDQRDVETVIHKKCREVLERLSKM